LAQLVDRVSDNAIDLKNGISIEIQAASFRSVRGYSVIAALCDEIGYWRSDELHREVTMQKLQDLKNRQARNRNGTQKFLTFNRLTKVGGDGMAHDQAPSSERGGAGSTEALIQESNSSPGHASISYAPLILGIEGLAI
jgi:hypothetical protein